MTNKIHESIKQRIDEVSEELISASHAIHANPELAFNEFFACETLINALENHDIKTEKAVYSLETSFEAKFSGSYRQALFRVIDQNRDCLNLASGSLYGGFSGS